MRSKSELIKRYIFFSIGLFINALGVALIIQSALGCSPIAVIPFVLNAVNGVSVGTYTFLLNMFLLALQIIILGKKFPKYQLLQIPVSLVFSIFVDLCLDFCSFLSAPNYTNQICILLLGCVIRALGVSIQVLADVVMLCGEAFVKAISDKTNKNFSNVKLIVDTGLTLVAIIISLVFLGKLEGVREGTLIAVVIIAPISRFFTNKLYFVEKILGGLENISDELKDKISSNIVITISTDYGSGGHKIGKIIADSLGYKLYDRNLVNLVSAETGKSLAYAVAHDEMLYKNWLESFYTEALSIPGGSNDPYADLFKAQKKVISSIAKENCVIIGHCANYILKNYPNAIHIHVHSDMSHRLKRITRDHHISVKMAMHLLTRRDKSISEYYRHFTGENWKDFDNYNITIDSGLLETEETAEILLGIIDRMKTKMN